VGRVHPTGAQDQVLGTARRDGQLTRQLAFAIHAQRVGGVVFGIGRRLAAIEHVVGGVVNQGDALGRRFFSKHARGDSIDREGQFRLVFGLVHGGVGCGNDEQVRLVRPHLGTDLVGLAKVQYIAAQDDQLAQAGKVLLQLNGHLTGLAADQDFQGGFEISHAIRSFGSVKPRRWPW